MNTKSLFSSLSFSPLLPWWVIGLLGSVSLILILYGFYKRKRGAVFYLLAYFFLLLWGINPQKLVESWHNLPETILLVKDTSPSMSFDHRNQVIEEAENILKTELQAHSDGLNFKTLAVSSTQEGGTHLFPAIEKAFENIPIAQRAGIIVLTDGQIHDSPTAVPEWMKIGEKKKQPLPFYALIAGQPHEMDRSLHLLQVPPFALVGQNITLKVQVDDLGSSHPTNVPLTLKIGAMPPVTRQVMTGIPQDISIPVTEAGPMLIEISAPPLPGEISTLNNRTTLRINAVKDRLKVLLVSGTPNQGERVWRWLLKADPSVDLIHFTILRPPEKDDDTPLSDLALIAFPVRELFQQKINQFDLIILDGFENRAILPPEYLENIANFVRKGGGLFLTAGPEFTGPGSLQNTSVSAVLPVSVSPENNILIQSFQPVLSEEGLHHPVTAGLTGANNLQKTTPSWGPWYRMLNSKVTAGNSLMEDPSHHPLLVLNHVDKGRVAMLLSDQSWLWSRGEKGGGPQAELLRRIAHWLMKEPELEEERLTTSINHGYLQVALHTLHPPPSVQVNVRSPSGQETPLTLLRNNRDVLVGNMPAPIYGLWEVRYNTLHAFAAPPALDSEEYADLRSTENRLTSLTHKTNGKIVWLGHEPAHIPQFSLNLSGNKTLGNPLRAKLVFPDRQAHIVTGQTAGIIFPAWLLLACFLIALSLAWYRERM